MRSGNKRLLVFILFFPAGHLFAQTVEILTDESYDLTLDGNETIRQAKIKAIEANTVIVEIEGAFDPIKIPRKEIQKALLLPKMRKIREYEVRLLGGLGVSAADLRLLKSSFPQLSVGFTTLFTHRLPYTGISGITAGFEYAHISDGERLFSASSLTLALQWRWGLGRFEWFFAAGGGVTGLYLVSYNFTRFRPNAYAFAELGAAHKLTEHIRLYVVFRPGWWPDSQAWLFSIGGNAGVAYTW